MTKNVRDVRGCKRYLLHAKSLYSKALRGYLGNVRDISIIGGEKNMYIQEYLPVPSLISISYNYILAICIKYIYLGRKRCKFYLLHLLQMIKEKQNMKYFKYKISVEQGKQNSSGEIDSTENNIEFCLDELTEYQHETLTALFASLIKDSKTKIDKTVDAIR